ncbi:GlmU family protein [Bacteroidota bacterium]
MANYILQDVPEIWMNLLPFTYTRPIADILVGILTIREKWERSLMQKVSIATDTCLSKKFPTIYKSENIFINASILPNPKLVTQISKLNNGQKLIVSGNWIATRTTSSQYNEDKLESVSIEADFSSITQPWHIFQVNAEQIKADFEMITNGRKSQTLNHTNVLIGSPDKVFIEEGASIDCATLNVKNGPIYIGKDTTLMEGSMIQGPFSLGDHSSLKMGAKIYPGTSIGPHCKVGGELNNVVIFGYSNKAHDGFLGQAVIGEWCNIGADSNNSNLKNTYENVKVWSIAKNTFVDTESQFCGLFMGDHSKCGINTMFNTGTMVGVSANIFGAGFPRTFIPSFSWGGANGLTTYRLDKAFTSMKLVMERRNKELCEEDKQILSHIFDETKVSRH